MPLKEINGYSELLEDFLADVLLYGVGVVTEQKLRRWTGAQRIRPRVWKIVQDVFEAVVEDAGEKHPYKLYVGEGDAIYSFMLWDRDEIDEERGQDSWWESVESKANPKTKGRGQNSVAQELLDKIIEKLDAAGGEVKKEELIRHALLSEVAKDGHDVTMALVELKRAGRAENTRHGWWESTKVIS